MVRKTLAGVVAVLASVGMVACGGGSTAPRPTLTTSTPENTVACHDFGRSVMQATASTPRSAFEQVLSEVLSATDPAVRRSGTDLRQGISANNSVQVKQAVVGIAQACRRLGLIDKDGNPT